MGQNGSRISDKLNANYCPQNTCLKVAQLDVTCDQFWSATKTLESKVSDEPSFDQNSIANYKSFATKSTENLAHNMEIKTKSHFSNETDFSNYQSCGECQIKHQQQSESKSQAEPKDLQAITKFAQGFVEEHFELSELDFKFNECSDSEKISSFPSNSSRIVDKKLSSTLLLFPADQKKEKRQKKKKKLAIEQLRVNSNAKFETAKPPSLKAKRIEEKAIRHEDRVCCLPEGKQDRELPIKEDLAYAPVVTNIAGCQTTTTTTTTTSKATRANNKTIREKKNNNNDNKQEQAKFIPINSNKQHKIDHDKCARNKNVSNVELLVAADGPSETKSENETSAIQTEASKRLSGSDPYVKATADLSVTRNQRATMKPVEEDEEESKELMNQWRPVKTVRDDVETAHISAPPPPPPDPLSNYPHPAAQLLFNQASQLHFQSNREHNQRLTSSLTKGGEIGLTVDGDSKPNLRLTAAYLHQQSSKSSVAVHEVKQLSKVAANKAKEIPKNHRNKSSQSKTQNQHQDQNRNYQNTTLNSRPINTSTTTAGANLLMSSQYFTLLDPTRFNQTDQEAAVSASNRTQSNKQQYKIESNLTNSVSFSQLEENKTGNHKQDYQQELERNKKQAQNLSWFGLSKRFSKMPAHRHHKNQLCWRLRESCLCNAFLSTLNALFPILSSFKNYNLPADLLTDLIAGLTIAVLHIPQGMAYGILAGVDPIYGLYVSFVPVLVMAFMSRSRHVSYGTFAVISMLMASATESVKKSLQQQAIASMAIAEVAKTTTTTTSTPTLQHNHNQFPQTGFKVLNKRQVFDLDLSTTNQQRSLEPIQELINNLIPSFPSDQDDSVHMIAAESNQADSYLPLNRINEFAETFVLPSNIEILGCICIVVGVIQIIMSLMRLGVLSLMFSDQLVSSFTTASAIHVVTSQLGPLFDLTMPHVPDGLFKVCKTWWIFGRQLLLDCNQNTAILSCISLLFLLSIKEILEPLLRKRYKSLTCLPSELVLMAIVIFSSWYWNFNELYNIRIIGLVPTGLPAFQAPRFDLYQFVLQDGLTIALVSFAMNLSLGQVYAKKYRYKLNPNQELLALGSANFISSFFSCFPCASSLSRSAVQSNLNARSQLCPLFSCAIVVSIICYFAPILHDLPRSTLSCIIIVALKGILVQVTDLYENWRLSKLDAFVWVLTFLSVIAFGVTYGLVMGIVASLFMIFFRLLTPNHSILGQLPGTDIYIDKNAFLDCEELSQVKIFRFNSPLCYLNRTMFKSRIEESLPSIYKQNTFSSLFYSSPSIATATIRAKQQSYNNADSLQLDNGDIRFLIIDCSALAYCDYSGAATLIEIIEELEEYKVTVYLAACPLKLIGMFEKMQKTCVLESNVYPSITEAVNHAKYLRNCASSQLGLIMGSPSIKHDPNSLKSVIEDISGSTIAENI